MALSQVQCLDDNHINLRTNESKPEFFYSEQQRLALETLIHEGRDAYEDYIKTNNISCFLSDLELERILSTVEVYSPGSPDHSAELLLGDSDGEEMSLQYWPDRSDRSIPLLDIGWPDRASYRGVTRAQVYTQPPYEGQSHIKEVVRKMISQAQKVIAIVMDLFTDIDIFKDLLDASYKRKVSVYIMLETTGVKHFLRMCEKAGMHTGHLKNLRVRSIRGAEFFSRFSKRVCGSQSQKFMFIDGDKAVSGSYSFTWSASRLDRNLITVLTGQAVDTFDSLFQDMYVISNGVCLSKINLSSEPEPEFLPKVVPTLLPSATTAFKLINPKYSLVSNYTFTTNGPASNQTSAKNSTSKNQMEVIKQMKETPVVPPVHPGLLNLEKANMINYVPTWPDPDPPSDVIGFINIRDSNKPLQAHLMRSELFEVSQAIRFKDPFHKAKESLSLRACPGPISQTLSYPEAPAQKQTSGEVQKNFDQNQLQRSSRSENLISPLEKPERVHVLACKKVNKEELCVMGKELDSISLQSKSINTEKDIPNTISSFAQDDTDTKQALDTLQPPKCPAQSSEDLDMKSSAKSNKSHHDSFALIDNPVKQSQDDQVINDVATQDHSDTNPDTNQNGWKGTQTSNFGSSISSSSDEYYECFSPVDDFRTVGDVFVPENTPESLHNSIQNSDREQEVPCSNSSQAQDSTDLDNKQTLFIPKLLKTSCSIVFSYLSADFKTTTATSKTTFAQKRDEGTMFDDSKLLDSETCCFSQIPNGRFRLSSTSEEYFECSGTVIDGIDHKVKPSSLETLSLNEQLQILKPVPEIEKLSELSSQNTKENDKPKMHFGQEQPEFQQTLDKAADLAVFKSRLDEKVHRQVQETIVTSEPVVESGSQEHEISESLSVLEIQSKKESVELAEKVEKEPLQDRQLDEDLDLLCEEKSVLLAEKDSNPQPQDLESQVSQNIKCEGQSLKLAEKTAKPPLPDLQPEVSLDLICKGQSVQLAETTTKPPLHDSQSGESPDLMLKPSEVNATPQLATDNEFRSSILQDKADVTPVIPEKTKVTKSIEFPKSEELQNPLADLDSESNHPLNLKSEEHVNKHLKRLDDEVSPAMLKRKSEEHNLQEKVPEQFETIELLILEDSDSQKTELNNSEPTGPRAALRKETKMSKTEPIEPKTINDRKSKENKLGHDVYSRQRKQTRHPTALIDEKQEGEHFCTNQMNKNLPEAKPKLECLVRKQPHQASSRIPVQARGGLIKLPISNPKAGMHRHPSGKQLGQNKPSIASSPSPEKLSLGGVASVRSTQRPPCTVPAPNCPTSPSKLPQVQLTAPKIRQSDQPNVSRKRSASLTKYSCSSPGISCPAQIKKQATKGSPPNK
uniref:Family with sequence similarity 83 member Ga n=1 Tax=Cyprinus carpio carpio TaxID=630221 RepID=A0A9J8B3M9_CYPCA